MGDPKKPKTKKVKSSVALNNPSTGASISVPLSEARDLIKEGWRPDPGQTTTHAYTDQDGNARYDERLMTGTGDAIPFDPHDDPEIWQAVVSGERDASLKAIQRDSEGTAFAVGAASAASFGMSTLAAQELAGEADDDLLHGLTESNPLAHGLGQATGTAATFLAGGAAKALTASKVATNGARTMAGFTTGTGQLTAKGAAAIKAEQAIATSSRTFKTALAEDAVASAMFQASTFADTNKEFTAESAIMGMGTDMLLGAGIYGAGRALGKGVQAWRARNTRNIGPQLDSIIAQSEGLAKLDTTTEALARRLEDGVTGTADARKGLARKAALDAADDEALQDVFRMANREKLDPSLTAAASAAARKEGFAEIMKESTEGVVRGLKGADSIVTGDKQLRNAAGDYVANAGRARARVIEQTMRRAGIKGAKLKNMHSGDDAVRSLVEARAQLIGGLEKAPAKFHTDYQLALEQVDSALTDASVFGSLASENASVIAQAEAGSLAQQLSARFGKLTPEKLNKVLAEGGEEFEALRGMVAGLFSNKHLSPEQRELFSGAVQATLNPNKGLPVIHAANNVLDQLKEASKGMKHVTGRGKIGKFIEMLNNIPGVRRGVTYGVVAGLAEATGGAIGGVSGFFAMNIVTNFARKSLAKQTTIENLGDALIRTATSNAEALVRKQAAVGSVRKAVGLVTGAIPSPDTAAIAIRNIDSKEEKRELYASIEQSLQQMKNNPDMLLQAAESASAGFVGHDSELGGQVAKKTADKLAYLALQLPVQSSDPLGGEMAPPSMMQVDNFLETYAALEDPLGVVHDIATGEISHDAVLAVKNVYPEMYGEMAVDMLEVLQEAQQEKVVIPYAQRLAFASFLGSEVEPTLNTAVYQGLQGMFAQTPAQAEAAGLTKPNQQANNASRQMESRSMGIEDI